MKNMRWDGADRQREHSEPGVAGADENYACCAEEASEQGEVCKQDQRILAQVKRTKDGVGVGLLQEYVAEVSAVR